jgi:GAF domain-containing protein
MKRRSRASSAKAKTARHKAAMPKPRNAKAARRRSPDVADHQNEVVLLAREPDEALEHQATTAEVLKIISRSTFDLQSVLDKLTESAARLCNAEMAGITREHDGAYYYASVYNYPSELHEFIRNVRHERTRGSVTGRALLEGKIIHVPDVTRDPEYTMREFAQKAGFRTVLGVPLLRQGTAIGVIVLTRAQVRPFNKKQIDLVETFAAQAVIAIENTRLLNELRQRTTDLTESLEQQTATADVLRVISNSPTDIQPVLEAIVRTAGKLCDAEYAMLYRLRDGKYHPACWNNAVAEWVKYLLDNPLSVGRGSLVGRTALERRTVHILDCLADAEYRMHEAARIGNQRTMLGVPLLRDGVPIGVIGLLRTSVKPFTEKQIELVTTFADQAVIAIENTRLLNELRQRTADLTESLEQQTATSEVLKVISRSAFDLQPVFDAMAENAVKLCEAERAFIFRFDGKLLRAVATYNVGPELREFADRNPIAPGRHSISARAALERRTVQVADVQADPEFAYAGRDVDLIRTILAVPMLKGDDLVGTITIYRLEVKPFTDKQVALVETFAAQAVIAIENTRLLNELRESLERQTSTADVLRIISSSPGDLQPVFSAMLESAARLCDASFGNIFRWQDDALRLVATYNTPAAFVEARSHLPLRRDQNNPIGEMLAAKTVLHVYDLAADERYINRRDPNVIVAVEQGGIRTFLAVPMLKDNELIGALIVYRQEVRPFSDKQIELVQNFAAQAVIAIENARLLSELRESLQQQTATSEVLAVISSSPGELDPVFQTILENATRICEAELGMLWRAEGDGFRAVSLHGVPPDLAVMRRDRAFRFDPKTPLGRVTQLKQLTHFADARKEPAYIEGLQPFKEFVDVFGARTMLIAPMLKEDALIGVIAIYRKEVRPFAEKQIALIQNFAAQAVIAIENARLLNELRQSLEQQTATADVLRVISSSPGALEPVFQSILEHGTRICAARFGTLWLAEQDGLRAVAVYNPPPGFADLRRGSLRPPGAKTAVGRVLRTKKVVQIVDLAADPAYIERDPARVELVEVAGARTLVVVPMLKDNVLVGAIAIYRQEVQAFTDKQIALLQNFADQAVIAIENTRLLSELRESLQQQTATADVLKVISRSTFDLKTVLQTLVESAARLCEADKATITRQRGDAFYRAEAYGFSPEFMKYVQDIPIAPERGSASGRALLEGRVIHIPDVKNDPEYTWVEAQKLGDFRTIIAVPMLREGVPIGVLVLTRSEVRPFTDRQIDLVTTFADQAAIAIENVRLFEEIQDKSRQLEVASQHKSQFLANMSHELRTPLNAILGYTELMADGAYGEPSEKMSAVLKRLESNGRHLLGLINDVLDLSKIEAGQLVLELSDYSVQDMAQTVRSTLEPLAADKKLAFKVEMAAELPPGRGDGRRLTQVLINLVGNAIKFTDAGEVAIKAEANNGSFYVSVRDTGPGISAADQTRLFQEFQQADNAITKKKGGTGLGLAISKRIIEMHGGRIWVESQLGQGATFAFTLPVIVERQVEAA